MFEIFLEGVRKILKVVGKILKDVWNILKGMQNILKHVQRILKCIYTEYFEGWMKLSIARSSSFLNLTYPILVKRFFNIRKINYFSMYWITSSLFYEIFWRACEIFWMTCKIILKDLWNQEFVDSRSPWWNTLKNADIFGKTRGIF